MARAVNPAFRTKLCRSTSLNFAQDFRMRTIFASVLSTALLASGSIAVSAAPAMAAANSEVVSLRRLTQGEYRNSIADIFGPEIEVRGVFEPDRRVGGLLAASTAVLSVTPVGFESFTKMADSIADQVT